ncbi:hypothetical protein LQ757_09945 [Agromyces sp. SYSU K20354]|uniref:hypothetical protein n=1 Tax=Agromyces cavernae TaxID=2898659 RepID=UPI001E49F8A8|nr:hypothetical protein [Agromyces cavernae]MCD2442593.1 hypothetical protein [Agromyces cavernae]
MGPLELDALIDRVVAEETAALRESFLGGAEFAVTGMESPRQRLLHRLECTVVEPHLDRRAQWTDARRARLGADLRYRPALPTLMTREAARRLPSVRSCKVCWPNIHGRDPVPLRTLRASGLRDTHAGRILSTEAGESLGAIARVSARTGPDLFGRPADAIEVVTSSRVFAYAPTEHVYLWNLPTDAAVIERKTRLFQRLGSDLAPAG